jgi:type II secretory ATPase GspE/PulE/Tfp pilus assembly ATPase PilB-like protein
MEDISKTIPVNYALKHLILPLREENGIEVIAMADTSNSELLNELKFIFNKNIITEKWPEEKLLEAIRQAYQLSGEELAGEESSQGFEYLPHKGSYAEKKAANAAEGDLPKVEDRSVIQLVNKFISEAIRLPLVDHFVKSQRYTHG